MDYYIWDKKSNLIGMSAMTILNSRPDFKYDDVIVIHKKGERENVVMVETKEGLKLNYDIDSDNADVVGFVTAVILGEDSPETIREKLEKIPEEKKEPEKTVEEISVDDYAKLIDNILSSYSEEKIQSDDDEFNVAIPLSGQYRDPFCRVIDKSDIPDDVYDKKLQLVIKHAFVTDVDNPIDLKCMYEKRLELDQLNDEREKHAHEGNYDLVEITTHKIESMQEEFMDSCDATLRLEAEVIYQYDDNMIVHLTNGQSMIINRAAVDSFRMNAISYEKRKEHSDEKYKVFYKSIDLELNSDLNEFREINNSIFIVTI
jgi:hypothetical protein